MHAYATWTLINIIFLTAVRNQLALEYIQYALWATPKRESEVTENLHFVDY